MHHTMNNNTTHPLQSLEWAEFRQKTGVTVVSEGNLQLTIHPIPFTSWNIGYLPKGDLPTKEMINKLKKIGEQERCVFIQLEPNVQKVSDFDIRISNLGLRPAAHPLFTKYTFQLDLTKSEEELLKNMHPKTRYNIKIAKKHDVQIVEDNSDEAFKIYLKLLHETTTRQKFYAHDEKYQRLMWEVLKTQNNNELTAHLFLAKYKEKTLTAWILFMYKNILYYPYGASSSENREVMASNLMMWEAIQFGKKKGCKIFDMWGALGPNPDPNDPWFGFHKFKQGYGASLVELIGSYDLVINPYLYEIYKIVDKIRWFMLRFK